MRVVKFVKTIFVDSSRQNKSQALVDIDGQEVIVDFWIDLIDQWGKEDVKIFICAEALKDTGNLVDAHNFLKPYAKDGTWFQNWMNDYPLQNNILVVDPLA
jgi:hypothetical protein